MKGWGGEKESLGSSLQRGWTLEEGRTSSTTFFLLALFGEKALTTSFFAPTPSFFLDLFYRPMGKRYV